jgi:CheY-specific phosphatase CheX
MTEPPSVEPTLEILEQIVRTAAEPLLEIELPAPEPAPPWPPEQVEVLVGVSLMGPWRGDLCLHLDQESALLVATAMLGAGHDGEPSLVHDAVKELANILAGACKHALDPRGTLFDLTVPRVIPDTGALPAEGEALGLSFTTPGIIFDLYLVREPEGRAAGPMISSWG